MKIDDLLILAGTHQLSTFDWGPRLVEVVNFVANDGHKVNLEMTGREAHITVRTLSSSKVLKMLQVDLDVETGIATGIDDHLSQPVAPVTVPEGPVAIDPYAARNENRYDGRAGRNDYDIEPPDERNRNWKFNPRKFLGLAIGMVIVFIGIGLAAAVTVTTFQTGTPTDSRGLVGVTQVLGDVVKSLLGSGSQTLPYGAAPYGTTPYGTDTYQQYPQQQLPAGPIGGPIGGPAPPVVANDTATVPPDDE